MAEVHPGSMPLFNERWEEWEDQCLTLVVLLLLVWWALRIVFMLLGGTLCPFVARLGIFYQSLRLWGGKIAVPFALRYARTAHCAALSVFEVFKRITKDEVWTCFDHAESFFFQYLK